MWEKIQKFVDRVESRIALWQIIQGGGVLGSGLISGWLSSGIAEIDQFGAFGWWTAFLVGSVLASLVLVLYGSFKVKYAEAKL